MLPIAKCQRIAAYNCTGIETFGLCLISSLSHSATLTIPRRPDTRSYNYNHRSFSTKSIYKSSSRSPSEPTMSTKSKKKELAVPRPSSSVVLISPENEVLLLHRVKTSTSFASAHVFPGGNISVRQDGEFTVSLEDPRRHYDGINYRRAAIRELFEESGILLATDTTNPQKLVHVDEAERERGRYDIHNNKIGFEEWLKKQNSTAEMDTDNLIPFTHWITPPNLPKRFSTQMYLYFLPIQDSSKASGEENTAQGLPEGGRQEVQVPTSDGGVEINEARFLPASNWLQQAQAGEIILYPPQFLLLSVTAQFLDQSPSTSSSTEKQARRKELLEFIHSGNPPWTDKFVCPRSLQLLDDKRAVLALDHPGPELHGSGKKGDDERVIVVNFGKDGPRNVEVRWKKDVLKEEKSSL
ncbi:NUDIX family hydrolase, putative [Talaromyces marneffei ATCC 18224]|uniref:NUDIX family hydrolase, putative n=1 Tax=Talaromyces marneffei (strain ATCC 18224 / CBS 334.59 / QM 7333) TaxID=441960 RepID=B6QNY1_TALMQ|nr:NUDIX family hydrolase, putative [Talaromyces marneffei ATCC 18224]